MSVNPPKPAVFLDRDGTLIEDAGYLADPAGIRLLPGVIAALHRLRAAGYALVIVTNQSGIGRGLLTVETVEAIHQELARQLDAAGTPLDAIYYCPIAPTTTDRATIEHPDRKPGPGMLQRGAQELHLDLAASWMIGDNLADALAGVNAGCRGVLLVRTGLKSPDDDPLCRSFEIRDDLSAAVEWILNRPL